jgi:hypothetical protein
LAAAPLLQRLPAVDVADDYRCCGLDQLGHGVVDLLAAGELEWFEATRGIGIAEQQLRRSSSSLGMLVLLLLVRLSLKSDLPLSRVTFGGIVCYSLAGQSTRLRVVKLSVPVGASCTTRAKLRFVHATLLACASH